MLRQPSVSTEVTPEPDREEAGESVVSNPSAETRRDRQLSVIARQVGVENATHTVKATSAIGNSCRVYGRNGGAKNPGLAQH